PWRRTAAAVAAACSESRMQPGGGRPFSWARSIASECAAQSGADAGRRDGEIGGHEHLHFRARGDRTRKDVGAIARVTVVGDDEERQERGAHGDEPFVIADEICEPLAAGCLFYRLRRVADVERAAQ